MKYLGSKQIADKWRVSERSVRDYCSKGLIKDAVKKGKTWYIPADSNKPILNKKEKLVDILLYEKLNKIKDSIYHYSQIVFAYNSNKIEGSKLTADQTQEIYETNSYVSRNKELVKLDDAIETKNHFRLFDYMLENYKKKITKKMMIEMNVILKRNTSYKEDYRYNVGGFKIKENEIGNFVNPIKTTKTKDVEKEIDRLLKRYYSKKKISIEDIIDFHVKFERIHPFGDGNGIVGRVIMFKECLKNNIVPFIISDDNKPFYLRGLKEYDNEKGFLVETILYEQDFYEKIIEKYTK